MLRSFVAALLWIGWASAASAASLSVTPDKTTYNVGETITLTVVGDDQNTISYGIFGRLEYTGALVNNGTRSQTKLVDTESQGSPQGPWLTGGLSQGDNGTAAFSDAFFQLAGISPKTASNLPGVLSTVTLIAQASGVVQLSWNIANGMGFELSFFGLTNAPGASFTIVPEPATLALLGFGLAALATRRRGRSS